MNDATRESTSKTSGSLGERLGAVARALLVFAGVAPFVPALTDGVPGLSVVGDALDAWFSLQCHREAERSFIASAVCVRCLGIYVGLALGALVLRPRLAPKQHLAWLFAAAAVLVLDALSEAFGLRPPNATLRFVTGFSLAYPAAVSIVSAFTARTRNRATVP